MLSCFTKTATSTISIIPIVTKEFEAWLVQQSTPIKNWLKAINYLAKPETIALIPDANGKLCQVLLGIKDSDDFWTFGLLPTTLPPGCYHLEHLTPLRALAWGLGSYQFARYKTSTKILPQLVIPQAVDYIQIQDSIAAIYLTRDLINTPAEDCRPQELAETAFALEKTFNANVNEIIGDDLLTHNYPMIHAVGRAAGCSGERAPRLIDLRWGHKNKFKLTLVGKGVCFDSGGLDIKPPAGMLQMKKDMGGAAHVLGLAHMIMAANLPIQLRVLIPAAENVIAGNAYKPGDVIKTRKGLTVEIGNTDAEGRLILCDALTEAVAEQPDLLINFATLTGAARVAVGTEIVAMFSNHDETAEKILQQAQQTQDPIWRLPLYKPYRKLIDSSIADINNSGNSPYAGAITAGLFLQEFVPDDIPWIHFDLMAWNVSSKPGKPEGGEAMGLRAVFEYLKKLLAC